MRRAALALIAPLFLAHPAGALSPDDVIRAALLNGWQTADGTHMAALRLDLAPKWKTYWRAPGDTGIPPVFDWSGSENLSAVRLHWPRPSVFHLNGMQTIGYHDALVLPVEVTPADPARPVRLKLRVDMGVCEDICMPASVSLAADLVAPGAPDAAIRAALDDQPERAAAAGLGDVSCAVTPIADGLRVSARMALPPVGRDEVVVFETGRDAVWIAESVEERQGGELLAWTEMVPPEGAPFALDRSRVVMTVIGEARAVEIRGCPAAP
jgi:DsbC/DsbD-like thiol-disulfide interchange protein